MKDLYVIIGVERSASYDTIKTNYQEKAKQFHPDKAAANTDPSVFVNVNKAWKILCKPELRRRYDAELYEYESTRQWPVNEEISLGDFDKDFADEEPFYVRDCRCGGQYVLPECESRQRSCLVICCDTCSLSVRVFVTNLLDDVDEEAVLEAVKPQKCSV
ncbi:PREDICTED: dnaJ homolog subfamily C member 24-like [Priapulus caudatus]|uniref:DnaJ homolog subfamily C member 24-like n=1 Tax=Priapulus caudatus TaxID=37621 RepID=A0ABM1E0B7_PRICU|nr:PREDICTED: dnaJ homolog subfamily C member 24-like [Priapulus caudatus]